MAARSRRIPSGSDYYVLIAIALAGAWLVLAVASFAPFRGDVTASNLPLASLVRADGWAARSPDLPESYLPHNWEYLLAGASAVAGERGVAGVNVLAFTALGLLLFVAVRRVLDGRTALLAVALFAFSSEMIWNFVQPKADAAASALAIAAIWLQLRYRARPARGCYFGSVALAGLALGTKMSMFVSVAPVLVLGYIWFARAERRWPAAVAGGVATVGLVAALTAPWWAVNWRATGNPFFPYFHSWLGGEPWVPTMVFGEYSTNLLRRLTLPVYIAVSPFENAGRINAAVGGFLPLGVVALWRAGRGKVLLLYGAALYVGYCLFSGRQEGRYFFPLLGVCAAISAFGVAAFVAAGGWRRKATLAVLALALFPVSYDLYACAGRLPAAVGLRSRDAYFARGRDLDLYRFGAYAARKLPPDAVVVAAWHRSSYYVPRRLITYRSPVGYVLHARVTPAQAEATLRAAGVGYLLVPTPPRLEPYSVLRDPAFMRRWEWVLETRYYVLYRFRGDPAASGGPG